jgi:mannose-6-phosphate isomerase-like protein (cupin superfamily)
MGDEFQIVIKMTEKCVSCGVDTGVNVHTHVDFRFYFVEGAGQLCKSCYNKVYNIETEEIS